MPRKYILALVVIAVVFFLGIGLLVSLVTGDRSENPEEKPVETTERAKELSTDTNSVSYVIYGPVVGEEDRRAIRITISANERRAEVLQGYYESIIKSQVTPNNRAAFDALLIALDGAGFDNYNTDNKIDERSVCATGNRFVYETKYSDDKTIRSWATSCGRKQGSFQGDGGLVEELMQKQIPEYNKFASDTEI